MLLFIDHKKFEYKYNFYEIKFVRNFKKMIKNIKPGVSVKTIVNENNISNSNGIVFSQDPLILCDTSIGSNISKFVLNYYALN